MAHDESPSRGKRGRDCGDAGVAAPPETGPTRTLYHYPSTLPFPVKLETDFPCETYRSRGAEVKTAVHWGQRKLLLSEVQLLCMYCKPDTSYHIVYVGSAPGTHLAFLDHLFGGRHTWELIDPGQFDTRVLATRPNFRLRNEFFTNATAYDLVATRLRAVLPALGALYTQLVVDAAGAEGREVHRRLQDMVGTRDVARGTEDIPAMYEPPMVLPHGLQLLFDAAAPRCGPLLFVSDIRSGSVALPNFEHHVAENMRAQACWTTILQAEHSMLKFRLPYTTKTTGGTVRPSELIAADGTVRYLRGDLLLPIWTRPTSTEGRLVVPRGAGEVAYEVAKIENQFFFFNARVRELVHFNHLLGDDGALDHHYDAAAEVHCLHTYLLFTEPALRTAGTDVVRARIRHLSQSITSHLGLTFEAAIRRREVVVRRYSRQQPRAEGTAEGSDRAAGEEGGGGDRDTSWEHTVCAMQRAAAQERRRGAWHRSVDEAVHHTPSGFWVTTTMPQ